MADEHAGGNKPPHEIVISYSTKDTLIAETVCKFLERKSVPCWMAPRDILGASDWDEAIFDAIDSCWIVLVVLSSKSNHSKYVKRELMHAVDRGKDILPLRIEDVEPSKKLRFALGTHHWVDAFPQPLGSYLDKLAGDIRLRLIKLKSEAPEVRVLAPLAGQRVAPGELVTLRWEIAVAADAEVEGIEVDLYRGSEELCTIADTHTGLVRAAREYTWRVPEDLPEANDYQLRIDVVDDEDRPACARANFEIRVAKAPAMEPAAPPPPPDQPASKPETAPVEPAPIDPAGRAVEPVAKTPERELVTAGANVTPATAEAAKPREEKLSVAASAPAKVERPSWSQYATSLLLIPGGAILLGFLCGIAGGLRGFGGYWSTPSEETVAAETNQQLEFNSYMRDFQDRNRITSPLGPPPSKTAAELILESAEKNKGTEPPALEFDPLTLQPGTPIGTQGLGKPKSFSERLRELNEQTNTDISKPELDPEAAKAMAERKITEQMFRRSTESAPDGKPAFDPNRILTGPQPPTSGSDVFEQSERTRRALEEALKHAPIYEPEPTWTDKAKGLFDEMLRALDATISGIMQGLIFGAVAGASLGLALAGIFSIVAIIERRPAEVVLDNYAAGPTVFLVLAGAGAGIAILFVGFGAEYTGLFWGTILGAILGPLVLWSDLTNNDRRQAQILNPQAK